MAIIEGVMILVFAFVALIIMALAFPQFVNEMLILQDETPGTGEMGGALSGFHEFLLFFIVPLLFMVLVVAVILVRGAMRDEAFRGRLP